MPRTWKWSLPSRGPAGSSLPLGNHDCWCQSPPVSAAKISVQKQSVKTIHFPILSLSGGLSNQQINADTRQREHSQRKTKECRDRLCSWITRNVFSSSLLWAELSVSDRIPNVSLWMRENPKGPESSLSLFCSSAITYCCFCRRTYSWCCYCCYRCCCSRLQCCCCCHCCCFSCGDSVFCLILDRIKIHIITYMSSNFDSSPSRPVCVCVF